MDLLLKDLMQLMRDWKTALFLLVMPIAFTLMFGFIFGGIDATGDGETEDARLPVGYLDLGLGASEQPTSISMHLLDMIERSDAIRPVELTGVTVERAQALVADGDLAGVVIVPVGYGERVLNAGTVSKPPPLEVIADPNSSTASVVREGVRTATVRLMGAVEIAQLSAQALEARGGTADEAFVAQALDDAVAAWQTPPLAIVETRSGATTTPEDEGPGWSENAYAHSSPGMMVQFSIAGLIGAANILVMERKSKCLRRLLTTAISRADIILGHFLTMFVMIFAQIVVLMAFGQILLGLDYLRAPLATLLLAVAMALWTASLGLLIGVLAKTEDQAVIFAMVPMFVFSGLGGAWMPLEFTSETFQTVGRLFPSAWAMDGLKNILVRGMGLESVWMPVGVMLAYGVFFFALAVWQFRFE